MTLDKTEFEKLINDHQEYLNSVRDGIVEGVREGTKEGATQGSKRAVWDVLKKESLPQGLINVSDVTIEDIADLISKSAISGDIIKATSDTIESSVSGYLDKLSHGIVDKFPGQKPNLAFIVELVTQREEKIGQWIGEKLPHNPLSSGIVEGVQTALREVIDRRIQGFRTRTHERLEGRTGGRQEEPQEATQERKPEQLREDIKTEIADAVAKVVDEIVYAIISRVIKRAVYNLKRRLKEKSIHALEKALEKVTKQQLEKNLAESTNLLNEEIAKKCDDKTSFVKNIDRSFGSSFKNYLSSLVPRFPIVAAILVSAGFLATAGIVYALSPTNELPVAEASVDWSEGLTVSFSSEGSYDPDGYIESYYWEFGDGFTSAEANPEHTYEEARNYAAVLTVTDDKGARGEDDVVTGEIIPVNEPPVILNVTSPQGWIMDPAILFLGPTAKAIDGSIYIAAYDDESKTRVMAKSTDFGRTWTQLTLPSTTGPAIGDIVCSSIDSNTVYVTNGYDIWKTNTGGYTWIPLPNLFAGGVGAAGMITSIDVGYIDGNPYIFAGTSTFGDGGGGAYVTQEVVWGMPWADLEVDNNRPVRWYWADIYDVVVAPDFGTTQMVMAVATAKMNPFGPEEPATYVTTKYGDDQWAATVEDTPLMYDDVSYITSPYRADIWLPADFNSIQQEKMQYFVGIASFNLAEGDVFIVLTPDAFGLAYAFDLNIAGPRTGTFVTDVKGIGYVGNALLLAGGDTGTGTPTVFRSTHNGATWLPNTKGPTGGVGLSEYGEISLVLADDFATSGRALAATTGPNCGLFHTNDGGAVWNNISLMDADIKIWFSGPMDKDATAQALIISLGMDYEVLWEEDDRVMIIHSLEPWQPDTLYRVTITSEAISADGVNLEEDYIFAFFPELWPQ